MNLALGPQADHPAPNILQSIDLQGRNSAILTTPMGLDCHGAAMLALAHRQGMPMRSVLTLGRQDSILTAPWLAHLQRIYKTSFDGLDCAKEPYAEAFFRRLGAERVESLDFSDYQGCTICRDLNDPPPEQPPEQTYDLVYDGGTLEHVFHFPNAIATCMSLVKVGGHFMASLPADRWLGHGFYQFSPELFFRVLCPENGFRVVRIFLAENPDGHGRLVQVIDPAETGARCLLQWNKAVLLLVWAEKIADVKPFQSWPKQSDYQARWEADGEVAPKSTAESKPSVFARFRRLAGKLVPISFKQRLAWQKHLRAAKRGMIELDQMR